jgi:hypothetical protein
MEAKSAYEPFAPLSSRGKTALIFQKGGANAWTTLYPASNGNTVRLYLRIVELLVITVKSAWLGIARKTDINRLMGLQTHRADESEVWCRFL